MLRGETGRATGTFPGETKLRMAKNCKMGLAIVQILLYNTPMMQRRHTTMKKILALVLVLMLAVSAAAMAETIKIGVFEPASGDNGAGGKQ